MSVQALMWVFDVVRGISPTQKLVLLGLANYADRDGKCWPRVKTLAADLELSDRAIRTALGALEESGHLTIERRMSEGHWIASVYVLLIRSGGTAGDAVPPAGDAGGVLKEPQEGTAADAVHKPSLEPSLEPRETKPKGPHPLPADFGLTPEMLAWAKDKAPSVDPQYALDAMRAWALGKSVRRPGWVATWQGFMLRDHKVNVEKGWKPKPVATRPSESPDFVDDGLVPVLAW